jgi:uncharacterized repeat protein (TIGR03803 family)
MSDPRECCSSVTFHAFLILVALLVCAATAIACSAQTFESLVSFDGENGAQPFYAPVVQGADGNFYGTTSKDGRHKAGTVFKMTPRGKLTTLHNFCDEATCIDGASPWAGVIQARNGNFYGTTSLGGTHGAGTVFKISRTGHLITLYSFCDQTSCTDGAYPEAGLVQGSNGNFYGTTNEGGIGSIGSGTCLKSPQGAT